MGKNFQGIEIEWDECITSWLVFYVMPKLVLKRTHSKETPNLIYTQYNPATVRQPPLTRTYRVRWFGAVLKR